MTVAAIAGTPATLIGTISAPFSWTKPAGLVDGETLIAFINCQGPGVTADLTPPVGWTRIGPPFVASSVTYRYKIALIHYVGTASSEPSSYSTAAPAGSAGQRWSSVCFRVSGLDTSNVVDSSSAFFDLGSNATAGNTAAGTNTGLVLCFVGGDAAAGVDATLTSFGTGFSNPAYFGNPDPPGVTAQGRTVLGVFSKHVAASYASEAVTWQTTASVWTRAGFEILLKDGVGASSGVIATPGVTTWTGASEIPSRLSVWDGTTEKLLSGPPEFPLGNYNWNDLVSMNQPFYIAHRGGSANWPELTMRAFDNCVRSYGMQAIEISAHITSDGVWVCSHDPNTVRTTGQSYAIASTPSATILALPVNPVGTDNQGQPAMPFAKLTDVLDKYAGTSKHVIFIEDKSYANTTSLINLIKTYSNYKEQFVWKVAGSTVYATFIAPALAAGLRVWGYFFEADMQGGSIQSQYDALRQPRCYLGLDYAATDPHSALMQSQGIPIIGHIVTTKAQRDRLLSYGAIGIMTANVKGIPFP